MTVLTRYNNFSAAGLIGPHLTKRQREALLELNGRCTLGNVAAFLMGRGYNPWLQQNFNTSARRKQLEASLRWFVDAAWGWDNGLTRDDRFSWIIRDDQVGICLSQLVKQVIGPSLGAMIDRLDAASEPQLYETVTAAANMVRTLERDNCADLWLRFVSLEGIAYVRRLRAGARTHIMKLVGRGCRSQSLPVCYGPWEEGFSDELLALPVTWLLQFDLTPRSLALVQDLTRAGYVNLGHLYVLAPFPWDTIRKASLRDWRLLRRLLSETPQLRRERSST